MGRLQRVSPFNPQDQRFMGLALRLARRMLGNTAPNPAVGAIIADEGSGEIISRGWTQPGGRPHAEAESLKRAGGRARGQTLYVTLEPCSHHGRTPPCADAVLAAGIRRVVCAIEDPDPRVSGKGLAILRSAGVAVDVGLRADEARWMAAGHILRMTRARPFVQLKLGVSRDGLIARGDGQPRWVTGPEARALGHLLRARCDVILVGVNTVIDDDPELTCRLPGLGRASPRRIVLDSHFRTPPTSRLARSAASVPVTIIGAAPDPGAQFPPGVTLRTARLDGAGRIELAAVLRGLHEDGVTRVLVEGGPTIAGCFIAADLIDEAVIFTGADPLGPSGQMPLHDHGLEVFHDESRWRRTNERAIGADRVTTFRARGHL
jgi:diaminohydroxyphosphoribosylaminopyrimidine deaminase/5-amino-6-(5-phosphoribosylamino)uracil reductase